MTIDLATEVASAPKYPGKRHNARERKVLETVKTYVDAQVAAENTLVEDNDVNITPGAGIDNFVVQYDHSTTKFIAAAIIDNNIAANAAVATSKLAMGSVLKATTGTGADVGKVTVAGMTSAGSVVVTGLEALGTDIAFSHVVCGTGIVTVYGINVDTKAVAGIDTKSVGILVVALS
jgi:hypothetical protein